MCAYLRKVNLVWLYIESRPAISPLAHRAQADWQRNISVSTLHSRRPNYMVANAVCWLDIKRRVRSYSSLLCVICSIFFPSNSLVARVMMFIVSNYFWVLTLNQCGATGRRSAVQARRTCDEPRLKRQTHTHVIKPKPAVAKKM